MVDVSITLEEFIYACATGDLEKVKKYISLRMDINKKSDHTPTPLWAALAERQFIMAEFLLKNGVEINKDDLLVHNCILTDVDAYLWELEFENTDKKEPDSIYIDFILRYKVDLNDLDSRGMSALDIAIEKKHPKAEKLLRRLGAKISKDINNEV